ncbi:MAG: hypothetical protein AB9846_04690 [Tenuifilaceae bacterium]
MDSNYTYKAFGLTIQSEFECPELKRTDGEAEVVIRFGEVPKSLENPVFSGVRFQTTGNEFLLTVDRIAKYYVVDGKRITIEVFPDASIEEVRLFLLGSAFGALTHQRGLLPFHGSSIKIGDSAIILTGLSGAGKSTLAAAFRQKGYNLLSDDVSVISFTSDQLPIVHPGYPYMKLWTDSIQKLGDDPANYLQIRKNIEKRSIPFENSFWNEPLPLEKIFIINSSNLGVLKVEQRKGIEKFNLLKTHTYRFNFIAGKQMKLNHFNLIGMLSKNVDLISLTRPSGKFLFDELINLVLENTK